MVFFFSIDAKKTPQKNHTPKKPPQNNSQISQLWKQILENFQKHHISDPTGSLQDSEPHGGEIAHSG